MKPASLSTVGSILSHHMTLSKLLPFISVMHFNLQGLIASLTPPQVRRDWPYIVEKTTICHYFVFTTTITILFLPLRFSPSFSRSLSGRRHRWHSGLPLHRCLRSIIDDLWSGRTPHWVLTVSSVLTQRVTLVVYGLETVRWRSLLGVSRPFIVFRGNTN